MTPLKRYFAALLLILLIGLWPLISVSVAGAVADANGCGLDEGSVHPCIVLGHDFGELLYAMEVLGWAGLVTMPIATLLFWVWVLMLVLHLVRRRSARGDNGFDGG
ncbi:hypothetical protein [Trinickia sp. EG282A]|uniref:hypothetical protein n=1 Tax=Trinickia sp. EG282A TaxID=3237013 RepID=UPI0034D26456